MMDLFLTNMLFILRDINWWTRVDYCDVFISCLDSHSDGTHSLQSIHWWASDVMLHFSKSDEETNSSTSWMARERTFSAKYIFFVCLNNSFKWIVHPKMRSLSLITLLNHWCHMDYTSCKDPCCLWRVRELSECIRNILICVLKMNECLTGLERHECE